MADVAAIIERQLRDIADEIAAAIRDEEAARERRLALTGRAQELETGLRVVREAMGLPDDEPSKPTDIPAGTIAEMAVAYMRAHGGEASVTELVPFLRERGKFAGGQRTNFYGTVFGTLTKNKRRFSKVQGQKGRFALVHGNGTNAI